MSRSLIVRFVLAGSVPLLAASAPGSATFALDGRELTLHDRVITRDTASGVDDVGMSFEDAPAQVTSAIHAYLDHQR